MSITLAVALAFVIVSVIVAAIFNAWTAPLVWIGWAFAVVFIVGPAIGNR
jgi:hypothetical protein